MQIKIGQGWIKTKRVEIQVRFWGDGESVEQFAQGSCGCPIPGSVKVQTGWGSGQPNLVVGNLVRDRGWYWMIFKGPPNSNNFIILQFYTQDKL